MAIEEPEVTSESPVWLFCCQRKLLSERKHAMRKPRNSSITALAWVSRKAEVKVAVLVPCFCFHIAKSCEAYGPGVQRLPFVLRSVRRSAMRIGCKASNGCHRLFRASEEQKPKFTRQRNGETLLWQAQAQHGCPIIYKGKQAKTKVMYAGLDFCPPNSPLVIRDFCFKEYMLAGFQLGHLRADAA